MFSRRAGLSAIAGLSCLQLRQGYIDAAHSAVMHNTVVGRSTVIAYKVHVGEQ